MLSGEIAAILMKSDAVNNEAIRKRISRTKPPVSKIKGFFADNQSFLYLQKQYNKEIFFDGLRVAFKIGAKRFYSILRAIEYHNGYLNIDHVANYSFSPISNLKGHKNISAIIKELINLNVLVEDEEMYRLHPFLLKVTASNYRNYKALETAKNFVLAQFLSWARYIGLSSFNTGTFHSQFAKFQWAFTSPSYVKTLPIRLKERVIPAFVVADILIGKEASEEDVNFFIEKILIVSSQRTPIRIIPFLIVESVSLDALKKLKENGVIIGLVNKLFGSEYQELLRALINTVANAGAILKKNPEAYLDLITKINKLVDGKTNNLRGDLFELAVGFYHSQQCQSLDIGKLINYEGQQREIDVFAVYHDHIVIAECKGYKAQLSKDVVEDWLGRKVSVIRDWILNQPAYADKDIVVEIWSTGGFHDEALAVLKEAKKRTKKFKIDFFARDEIIEKAKSLKSRKFNDILQQYYFGEEL